MVHHPCETGSSPEGRRVVGRGGGGGGGGGRRGKKEGGEGKGRERKRRGRGEEGEGGVGGGRMGETEGAKYHLILALNVVWSPYSTYTLQVAFITPLHAAMCDSTSKGQDVVSSY